MTAIENLHYAIGELAMQKKAPINDIGTANVGIRVERQSPKKINTTSATRIKASLSVSITFSMDASKKLETS